MSVGNLSRAAFPHQLSGDQPNGMQMNMRWAQQAAGGGDALGTCLRSPGVTVFMMSRQAEQTAWNNLFPVPRAFRAADPNRIKWLL